MRKQLFILFSLMIIIGKMSAQLTLDHTFNGYVNASFSNIISEPVGYYCSSMNNASAIYLYNPNYSLYKTVSINLPSGYSNAQATVLGKHLINTDDKVEFFVTAYNSNNSYNSLYTAMIVNEDGTMIQHFGYSYTISYLGIYVVEGQLRLSILKATYNEQSYQTSYQTEVYVCQGNYSAVASFGEDDIMLRPYPNPTTTLVNLPYHIEKGTVSTINIYNVGGQLIESYNIGGDFERITIDVNNYAKGIYIYEYNGISNRFVVQ